jgi:hypothetical protein
MLGAKHMDDREYNLELRKYRQEWWKVAFSALTSVVLIALTFIVQDALHEREASLKRREQILIEKQKLYGDLGQKLNVVYVYIADIGDYKQYTPEQIVQRKRESDRLFFMYRPFWSDKTEEKYKAFMDAAFRTYTGAGLPAQINARKHEKVAAYEADKREWDKTWNKYFTEEPAANIDVLYSGLVGAMLEDVVSGSVRGFRP